MQGSPKLALMRLPSRLVEPSAPSFSFRPVAQGRISDAVIALRKFGSYGDIVWFGFGVEHVVTDLAETEEGLTLVAICAALSTTYDS